MSHLPRFSDRMQRLRNSPADSAAAEAGFRSPYRRLKRLEGSLDKMWEDGAIPNLVHAAVHHSGQYHCGTGMVAMLIHAGGGTALFWSHKAVDTRRARLSLSPHKCQLKWPFTIRT